MYGKKVIPRLMKQHLLRKCLNTFWVMQQVINYPRLRNETNGIKYMN